MNEAADLVGLVGSVEELEKVIDKYRPQVVVVEDLFVSKNIKAALKLGHARGVGLYGGQ